MMDFPLRDYRLIVPQSRRTKPRECIVCSSPTRHNKPYCSEHIGRSEYVSNVVAQLEKYESGDSILLEQEILFYLKTAKQATLARIAKDLKLNLEIVLKVIRLLARRKLVKRFRNKRRIEAVRL